MTNEIKKRKTKKEICEAALPLINSYEVKSIKLSTLYRRAYKDSNGNYKYIGKAHDYTL